MPSLQSIYNNYSFNTILQQNVHISTEKIFAKPCARWPQNFANNYIKQFKTIDLPFLISLFPLCTLACFLTIKQSLLGLNLTKVHYDDISHILRIELCLNICRVQRSVWQLLLHLLLGLADGKKLVVANNGKKVASW